MPRRAFVILLLLGTCLSGCRGPSLDRDGAACTHLGSGRTVRGVSLCEDVWTCERSPGGSYDRIALRRLAPCGNLIGPMALVLPDRHMSSETGQTEADADVRLYLAQAGV